MRILKFLSPLVVPTVPLVATTGHAQVRKPQITGDIVADTKANFGNAKSAVDPVAAADELWKKIQSASAADLKYAKALADNVASPGAKLRATCYGAWIVTIEQSQGVGLKDQSGNALTQPEPHVFSSFEQLAEIADNLQPTGPLMAACSPAWTALKLTATQFFSMAVSGATGLAALGIAIP
jgi:hypothetical protein